VTIGLVTSLARPGGNVTGLSLLAPELVGKRLELLKQAVPGVGRVAALWQPGFVGERTEKDMLKEVEVAARALGVRFQFVEARGPADFDRAFADMTRARADALTVLGSAMFALRATTRRAGARPSSRAGWNTRRRARPAPDGSERHGTRRSERRGRHSSRWRRTN
jgi:ABC-type uncharacterized transport system substrate-binding protein